MPKPDMSFDPDWLQKAANELGQLNTLLEHNLAWKDLATASHISGDLSSLNQNDDSLGAWTWLEKHTSDICTYVSTVTNDIKTEATKLQSRMQSTIDILNGSDKDNKDNLQTAGGE